MFFPISGDLQFWNVVLYKALRLFWNKPDWQGRMLEIFQSHLFFHQYSENSNSPMFLNLGMGCLELTLANHKPLSSRSVTFYLVIMLYWPTENNGTNCFHSLRVMKVFLTNTPLVFIKILQRVSSIKDHGNVQIWKYFVTKFRLLPFEMLALSVINTSGWLGPVKLSVFHAELF